MKKPASPSTPAKTGMKRGRKSWSSKLRPEMSPALTDDTNGPGQLLLPTPLLIAEEIATIPAGEIVTVPELRERLARRFGAERTCPLMTGIFYNLVAGAAEERIAEGQPPLAPYWRVIRDDGSLSPKTPDGPERQAEHLRAEGHTVTAKGTKWIVTSSAR